MDIVIPSRGRPDRIWKAMRMLPNAVVTVDEREEEGYRRIWGDRVVPHPPLEGIAAIRQWILDNFHEKILVMVDDDLDHVQAMVTLPSGGIDPRITDPRAVGQILENTAMIAQEIGAPMFGYTRARRPVTFSPLKLFSFTGFVQGVVGFVGRKVRYDLRFKTSCEDLDIVMSALLKGRFVLQDMRFYWSFKTLVNRGGLSQSRRSDQIKMERELLKTKWGKFLARSEGQNNNPNRDEFRVAVRRSQPLLLT